MAATTITGGGAYNAPEIYRDTALTNTAVTVSATAATLKGWNFINTNAAAVYIHFYDNANPVVGTTAVVKTLAIPASSTVFQPTSGYNVHQQYFKTAITLSCTTGIADNDSIAPAAGVYGEIYYK